MGKTKPLIMNKIKQKRKQLLMTQQELADKTQLTRIFISMVENNRVPRIGLEPAKRIARVLNSSIEELFY